MINVWRKLPVLRVLLPFILGILLQINFNVTFAFWAVSAVFLLLMLLIFTHWHALKHHSDILFNVFLFTLYLSLGGALTYLEVASNHPNHFGRFDRVELVDGVLISEPERGANTYKTTVQVKSVVAEGSVHQTSGTLLLYVSNRADLNWQKGDRLLLTQSPQKIDPPQNPGEFDYRQFLQNRGITHRLYLNDPSQAISIQRQYRKSWLDVFDTSRDWLVSQLRGALHNDDAFAVSSALILGQKEYLSPQIRSAYAGTGAMHVLAVSGLHVGIIYFILTFMLGWLGQKRLAVWTRLIFILAGLWSYAILTGLSPSVLRASVMFSAIAIAQIIDRKTNIYNTLASAALILLCFNPFLIMEIGFQLSFAAVLGIVLLFPVLYELLFFRNKWSDKIWQLACVSIAAQIATFPLGIYYFNQFPNYFLLSNFVVIPAAFVILPSGLIFLALSWVPVLGDLIGNLVNLMVFTLNSTVRQIESLPHATSHGLYITSFETWLIFGIIGSVIAVIYLKDRGMIKIAFAGMVVLLASFTWRVESRQNQQKVVLNSISRHFSLNLTDGRHNILIADSALIADNGRQQYHLEKYWSQCGYDDVLAIDLNDTTAVKLPGFYRYRDFIIFHGYRIKIQGDIAKVRTPPESPPKVDLLILRDRAKVEDADVECQRVALASNYRYRNLCCDSLNVSVVDVRREGALQVSLNSQLNLPLHGMSR